MDAPPSSEVLMQADRAITGLAAAIVSYGIVWLLLAMLRNSIQSGYPDGKMPAHPALNKYWESEFIKRTPGGVALGLLEVVIFYAALQTGVWALAASYIALKVASKWNSWTTTWQALRSLRPKRDSTAERVNAVRSHPA
jgi:hypothetical protein